jgi:hypothetical protein
VFSDSVASGHHSAEENLVTRDPASEANQERDAMFASFAQKRRDLNQQLDESRQALDVWFERQRLPAPMTALANLEVLLKKRRDLLEELVQLDDEFMLYLIKVRNGRASDAGKA